MKPRNPLLFIFLLPVLIFSGFSAYPEQSPPKSSVLEYTGYGANRCVSGSFHVVDFDGDLLILDAGIFYGGDEAGAPEIPSSLPREATAMILSHAHLDHAGRLMGLVKSGYRGPIYCSLPSRELLPAMLAMSASSGDFGRESFFYSKNSYRNNRREKKDTCVHLHDDCPWGEKIKEKRTFRGSRNDLEKNGFYLCKDCAAMEVEEILEQVRVVYPGRKYHLTPRLEAQFYNTPHLPGAMMVLLTNPQTSRSLLFTGDYGSGSSPFLADQDQVDAATWAIIEGTYGPERSATGRMERTEFQKIIGRALKENKRVIIPSFVLDRSQQVLREISNGIKAKLIPAGQKVKIFSPSATEINRIYSDIFTMPKFSDYFRDDYAVVGPFDDICRLPSRGDTEVACGEIASCSSGMADSGYALGFVKRWIDDPRTIFIFVGYQSPLTVGGRLTRLKDIENIHLVNGTVIRGRVVRENPGMLLVETDRGRRAVRKIQVAGRKPATPRITIDGKTYPVRAEIKKVNCFSGHGKPEQIKDFLRNLKGLETVLIVHSEAETSRKLAEYYRNLLPEVDFIVPRMGKSYRLAAQPDAKTGDFR